MPNALVSLEQQCAATLKTGARCQSPHVRNSPFCFMHDQPTRDRIRRAKEAMGDTVVSPDLSIDQLAHVDLTSSEGIASARVGIFQHLLAGSLESPVAKTALDVAETIHKNARAKPRDTKSTVERMTEAVISKPPPQPDAE